MVEPVFRRLEESDDNFYCKHCINRLPEFSDFWPTIKPFLSKKGQGGGTPVVLSEGGKVVIDQTEVCFIFNNFFVYVAKYIGTRGTQYDENFSDHPSIKTIKENLPENLSQFSFRPVNSMEVSKIILISILNQRTIGPVNAHLIS